MSRRFLAYVLTAMLLGAAIGGVGRVVLHPYEAAR